MVTFQFQNSYRTTVWVVGIFYDPPDCTGYGNWMIRGWWEIEPGQTVAAFESTNQYAGYYAEAADGSYWAGSYGPYLVTNSVISLCYDNRPAPPNFAVGMRLINANPPWWAAWWNYTVNLTA